METLLELAHRHARLEEERSLDALMETLVAEPEYEFHPLGLGLSGGDRIRRYYAQLFEDFMAKIVGYELLAEWANAESVVQEYDIRLSVDGREECHRVIGILFGRGDRLGGERIYGSERLIRLMLGRMFGELEPLA